MKDQPSSGHIFNVREKRLILPRSWRLYLIVLKVGACLASWCLGNTFPSPSNICGHLRHSSSYVSHEPSDMFSTWTWVCMGLVGFRCLECLPVVTCDFEPPEHGLRTSARAYACAVVIGRAPCMPRSPEREKRHAGRNGKKLRDVHKK